VVYETETLINAYDGDNDLLPVTLPTISQLTFSLKDESGFDRLPATPFFNKTTNELLMNRRIGLNKSKIGDNYQVNNEQVIELLLTECGFDSHYRIGWHGSFWSSSVIGCSSLEPMFYTGSREYGTPHTFVPTATAEILKEEHFRFYPNPTRDRINLITPFNTFVIRDLNGTAILQGEAINDAIDISALNSGFYLLELTTGNSKVIERFEKL
jgi:hypothetical protein